MPEILGYINKDSVDLLNLKAAKGRKLVRTTQLKMF